LVITLNLDSCVLSLSNPDASGRKVGIMLLKRFPKPLLVFAIAMAFAVPALAQDRKMKDSSPPAYPEMAKSMHLAGSVKVQITITPQGLVRDAKVLGGHPLLADAALRAITKWKYEPGAEETKVVQVDFKRPD
jgi:TonB family protein